MEAFWVVRALQEGNGEEGGVLTGLLGLAILLLFFVGLWKVFTKAGQPGWAAIVPFYNVFVLLRIVGRPAWWLLLIFVPFVNIVVLLVVYLDLAKRFGKGAVFGVGLWLLGFIFLPILAFSDATYTPPTPALRQQGL